MKLDALEHPKTLDFAARLNITRPTAIGHLELLWSFVGKNSPRGDVGKWPDGSIARACDWMGPPQVFIQALIDARLIESDDVHRLVVHDWRDHAAGWVRAKLAKLGVRFIATSRDVSASTNTPTGTATGSPTGTATGSPTEVEKVATRTPTGMPTTQGREGKRREGKGSKRAAHDAQAARERAYATPGLDVPTLQRWEAYRVELHKPLPPQSLEAVATELAKHGADQAAVVQQSIANGWRGLFDLKTANGGASQTTAADTRYDRMVRELSHE
jgi:hypothetical protein